MKKKMKKLRRKYDALLDELDALSHQLKLRHIEYTYLCELRTYRKKTMN